MFPVKEVESTFPLLPLGRHLLPLTTLNRYLSGHSSTMSQGLLGLCCLIETRDRIERITLTAVLFK